MMMMMVMAVLMMVMMTMCDDDDDDGDDDDDDGDDDHVHASMFICGVQWAEPGAAQAGVVTLARSLARGQSQSTAARESLATRRDDGCGEVAAAPVDVAAESHAALAGNGGCPGTARRASDMPRGRSLLSAQ